MLFPRQAFRPWIASVICAVVWLNGVIVVASPNTQHADAALSANAVVAERDAIEDAVLVAVLGDHIIEFYGAAGSQQGVIGVVHQDADRIVLLTLASQRKDAPWYAMESCALSADRLHIVDLVGGAAPAECESAFFISALASGAIEDPLAPRRDGARFASELMQARALRAHCQMLSDATDADARVVLREQCETQLKALRPMVRGQSIRTLAELLAWVELMDAKQCALRLLEGWRASEGVCEELVHALQGIGASRLSMHAKQLYLPLDGACVSICASACYNAMAWEIVEAFAARMATMRAGVRVVELELAQAVERAIADCAIDEITATALRADLRVYLQELAGAVPTTLRMTPQLAQQCAGHVREMLCVASAPAPDLPPMFTTEIRCRNELVNEMLKVYGRLLHASDLLNNAERITLATQVAAIAATGTYALTMRLDAYRDYQASQGRSLSAEYQRAMDQIVEGYRQETLAPLETEWSTWNLFPFPSAALSEGAAEVIMASGLDFWEDSPLPGRPPTSQHDVSEESHLNMFRSRFWGYGGITTMLSYHAGSSVIGDLSTGLQRRGIPLQPFSAGGASYGYATPGPWSPRLWFDRRKLGAPR
ncbi:MAG: hypothetical protein EXS10_09985 [Phycisphaerales bacterium]|nr:hypothetical protein [Phycisphaerales bacterium]